MSTGKISHELNLRRAFSAAPPKHISQEPFDSTRQHLKQLGRLRAGDNATAGDLWEYTQDLLYGNAIQTDLLQYLLPFCLEAWHHELNGTRSDYGGFVEYFYPVLANKNVFSAHLTSAQTAAVSDFMRASILEEMDEQRGLNYEGAAVRPYTWIGALTTYGVVLPDIEKLWTAWWRINTIGKAVSAVQYLSCLLYANNENPVFASWSSDKGGGPPALWGLEGHLYEHRWLQPNVDFLRQTLRFETVDLILHKAEETLKDQPEHAIAAEVIGDIPLCSETIAARCAELPNLLETRSQPGRLFEWTL